MLDAILQIEDYLNVSYAAFCRDRMRQDAVVRQLEIIGEASRRLSAAFRDRHPAIPWQDIIGMRQDRTRLFRCRRPSCVGHSYV